jgi:Subtilase family
MRGVTRAGFRPPLPLWGLALLLAGLALASPRLAAAASAAPLPESDYTIRPACPAPAPGHASCLALELAPRTAAARTQADTAQPNPQTVAECAEAFPSACMTPQDLRDAYFPGTGELPEAPASEPQTIALVDAYNDPKARADLQTYEAAFGLNKCSAASSACFEQVNQNGEIDNPPFPASEEAREAELSVCENTHLSRKTRETACENVVEAEGWAVEISTDIEVARGICNNCKILLVDTDTATYPDLEVGEETAARLKATEISDSWGGEEPAKDSSAFKHPGTIVTAAAGDDGYLNWTEAKQVEEAKQECLEAAHGAAERLACDAIGYSVGADYPASSPHVIAVGGTKLTVSAGARSSETVWNEDPDHEGGNEGAGGGGCASEAFPAPAWQLAVPDWSQLGCGSHRAVADVAADADPYTGVAVYDSVPDFSEEEGTLTNTPLDWWPIGGTSVASPIIASMFALAGGAHGVEYPAATLYSHLETTGLYNVTKGGNGKCDDLYTSCAGSLEPLSPEFPFDCGEGSLICNAAPGCGDEYYDGPTGVGTPNGIAAFKPGIVLPPIVKPACAATSEPKGKTEGGGPGATANGKGSGGEPEGSGGRGPGEQSAGGSSSGAPDSGSNGGQAPGASSPSTAKTTRQAARISALALTANARLALRHPPPALTRLAFSCTLSRSAKVRVTLSIQIRLAGHTRWRKLPASLTFNAVKGLNRRRLHGAGELAPGVYRLTLTPAGGRARSITFRVA